MPSLDIAKIKLREYIKNNPEKVKNDLEQLRQLSTMSNEKETCTNCKNFYYSPRQLGQPYDEYFCKKGHFDSISTTEEYNELSSETYCKDFETDIN